MATIAYATVEQLTEQTKTGDTNWSDISGASIAAGSFVAGAKYLILASAQFGGNDANVNFGIRLVHGTTPTVFPGSTQIMEPPSATASNKNSYLFQVVWTQPGTAELVKLQFQTADAAKIVNADSIRILAIRLDASLTDGSDYKYGEDDDTGAPVAIEDAVWTDFASITFTPANANDDWLVVGCFNWRVDNSTFYQTNVRLNRDSDTELSPSFSEEGEDTAEERVRTLARVFTLSAASHTFKLQANAEEDNADQDDHQWSSIFALRLNAFRNHIFNWTEAEFANTVDATYEEMTGLASYTPDVAGDNVIVASAVKDGGVGGQTTGIRVQVDGATVPTGFDSSYNATGWDNTDENPMSLVTIANMAASARDIDFDGARLTGSTLAIEDRSIAVFSLELPGGGPQTITAGVVAIPSAVPTAIIKGSGAATLIVTPVAVPATIPTATISGSGATALVPNAVTISTSVPTASIATATGPQTILAPVVAVPAVVSTASISGSGTALLTPAPVTTITTQPTHTIRGSGVVSIVSPAVAVVSSVTTPSIAGSGTTTLTAPTVAVALSVVAASVAPTGAAVITPASLILLTTVVTALIAGSGTATPVTPSPVTVPTALPTAAIQIVGGPVVITLAATLDGVRALSATIGGE